MRILLIEDEAKLAVLVKNGLEKAGHSISVASNAFEGIAQVTAEKFDLILLDIMLPDKNGFDLLKELRSSEIDTPVIFMSALAESEHVIKGLDLGAVDYVKKPFDFEELKARIRNVQRKFGSDRVSLLRIEDLEMDLIKREVSRAGDSIELSKREFSILELLLNNTNRPISKAEITEKIWKINFDMGTNVIEVHMHQLRKKIDQAFDRKLIETKVGEGYLIAGELIKN
ncbi:response regulator transcription factor [Roseivirga sp. E12]|uniref:response regulator transcription factor n=1 Tax=Roseivirga sp. E12 TaxID=2819237 RepID=UPI001ABCA24C|nr:response regulator transcription factor [Roseivirga sp. E12]MBO3698781.1 response regulator transcription factor [Roseivirga sp. E12]